MLNATFQNGQYLLEKSPPAFTQKPAAFLKKQTDLFLKARLLF
jgi:hypothetical protein